MEGAAFGATSTLVAQLGILVGMVASNQPHSALVVASAVSAFSGSLGDAFSMFISKSTAGSASAEITMSVLISKLALGAVYTALFYFFGKTPRVALAVSTVLTLILLALLSRAMTASLNQSAELIFAEILGLTLLVVGATSSFGFLVRGRL